MATAKPGTQKQSAQTSKPSGPTFTKGSAMEFGGGRWEGGIATIVAGKYGPWCYPKKPGDTSPPKHTGFGTLILREEDGTEHEVHYQAGFFGETDPSERGFYNNAYPSKDGVYPSGPEGVDMEELLETYAKLAAGELVLSEEEMGDYEGTTVVFRDNPAAPGVKPKLSKKDWSQLSESVVAIGKADGNEELRSIIFDEDGNLKSEDFDAFNGMKFNWIYEKQKYVSKKMKEQGKDKFEVLIPDQFFGLDEEWLAEQSEAQEEEPEALELTSTVNKKTTGKKATAPPPEPEEDEEEQEEEEVEEEEQEEETEPESEDPFGDRVDLAVLKALRKLGRPAVRRDFNAIVASSFKTTEQKKVLDYLNNPMWMASKDRSFTYDKNNSTWSA